MEQRKGTGDVDDINGPEEKSYIFFLFVSLHRAPVMVLRGRQVKEKRPFTVNALWLLSPTLRFEEK